MSDLALVMARQVKRRVRAYLDGHGGHGHRHQGASGDLTFDVDEVAEQVLEELALEHRNVAFLSEDRGLVAAHGRPEHLAIVDPIDGTRPTLAGLPTGMVSVALLPFDGPQTLGAVQSGALVEILGEGWLSCSGPDVSVGGGLARLPLRTEVRLERLFWMYELAGRPQQHLVRVLGDLIDRSSLTGGCFSTTSAAFSVSRICLGRMDLFVDVNAWLAELLPDKRDSFQTVGRGKVGGVAAHDIAAALAIARACGVVATTVQGDGLDQHRLDDWNKPLSCVVSSHQALHDTVLDYLAQHAPVPPR